jgi:hypothetical protein
MQVVEQQQSQDSIIKSLSELRDIERQRIADELSAVQRADAARIAAREEAERRAYEEAEARVRAEREARQAAEQARLAAEREERLRIEAAAAAELGRQQIALEQTRMEREHELQRAAIAQTRPTWMKAVVGVALAAAGSLLWVTLASRSVAQEASDHARLALADRDQAREDARSAREGLESVQRSLDENGQAIRTALGELGRARTQSERDAIEAKIKRQEQRVKEIEDRRRRELDEKLRQERLKGVVVPEECKTNAFAPGCSGK